MLHGKENYEFSKELKVQLYNKDLCSYSIYFKELSLGKYSTYLKQKSEFWISIRNMKWLPIGNIYKVHNHKSANVKLCIREWYYGNTEDIIYYKEISRDNWPQCWKRLVYISSLLESFTFSPRTLLSVMRTTFTI